MKPRSVCCLLFALVVGVCAWSAAVSAAPARPVYVDIHPVADSQVEFSDGLIAAMVGQALSAKDLSMIRTRGDSLPTGVLVLRVLYVVRKQKTVGGVVMAASAKIDLLRTASDRHDTVLATSIYSGVAQTLLQGADAQATKKRLRTYFKDQLRARIDQAFAKESAYH